MPTTVSLSLSSADVADSPLPVLSALTADENRLQLILADKFDPYKLVYEDCLVFNPGSFARRRFGWSTYYPQMIEARDRMEESSVSPFFFPTPSSIILPLVCRSLGSSEAYFESVVEKK